jgi:hypothetical protein
VEILICESLRKGNTSGNTMKTLTVKIPEVLNRRLRKKAELGGEQVSALKRPA